MKEHKMTRKDFLKKTAIGALGLAILGKTETLNAMSFTDNIKAGVVIGPNAPSSTKSIWIDTSIGGVQKYFNGTAWVPTKSVWG